MIINDYFQVGNKCDLEEERVVPKEEGQALADEYGCPYYETSAKDHVNVDESFSQLVREVRRTLPKKAEIQLDLPPTEQNLSVGGSSGEVSDNTIKKKKGGFCNIL